MNDSALMNGCQPGQNFSQPYAPSRWVNGSALDDDIQVSTVNVIHNQEKPVLPNKRVAYSYDIRVGRQFGQEFDFLFKQPTKLRHIRQFGVDLLDGEVFFQVRVESFVNRAKTAAPYNRQNFILVYSIHDPPFPIDINQSPPGSCH